MMNGNGWGMGGMAVLWILAGTVCILLIIFLTRNLFSSRGQSPEEILKERYARGEISQEQYEAQLKTLRG